MQRVVRRHRQQRVQADQVGQRQRADRVVAAQAHAGIDLLGAGASEPTGETDLGAGDPGAANDHSNLTVDFGFVPALSLGNLVWLDLDGDGTNQVTEPGISNVVISNHTLVPCFR